ncbi:MAG TPA: hypothetical protein QF802_06415, partial [Candidatus Thalassarchaeaceae archaeon]|nr:hypothetical protein [Candidatus Thalassarchaeaceae archaeon]
DSLCLNPNEAEHLSERVLRENLTDVVITGCDGNPIPGDLKRSLSSVGCKFSGLNRLSTQLHSDFASQSLSDFADRIDLVRASRPWSKQAQGRAQLIAINEKNREDAEYLSSMSGIQPWGLRLTENQIWVYSGESLDAHLDISFYE